MKYLQRMTIQILKLNVNSKYEIRILKQDLGGQKFRTLICQLGIVICNDIMLCIFLACSSAPGNFSCWLYSEHSGDWEKMSMPTAFASTSEVVIGNSLSIPDKGIYFFASNSTDNSSTGLLLKYRLVSFSLFHLYNA